MADKGFRVAGYNRSREVTEAMVKEYPHDNFTPFYDLREFVEALARPRKVMLMIKAGGAVDAVIGQLTELLEEWYQEGTEEFHACVEYFTGGSSDRALEEYIGKLHGFAISHPWPEEWLKEREEDYKITDVSGLEAQEWVE